MSITKSIYLGDISGSQPWSALRGFVDDINAREPNNQNAITVIISGGSLSASVERKLTPAEEVQHLRSEMESQAQAIRDKLTQQFGRGLSAETADELRRMLGLLPGHAQGTQAPAAPGAKPNTPLPPAEPLTDEQRRDLFRSIAKVRGGWDLSTVDGARSALTYVRQQGMPDLMTAAEVERWEGLAPGSLGG